MTTAVHSPRALNRATLARQLLLQRSDLPILDAVEHLVGLQAQTVHSWYQALWARLDRFDPRALADLLEKREVVRIALMRSTIHLVTADDCLVLRPLVQPVMDRWLQSQYHRQLAGLDIDSAVAMARDLVEDRPRTFGELGKLLAARWPDGDPHVLSMVARCHLALVQVPPRGVWGRSGPAAHTTAESWLGRTLAPDSSLDAILLRYLRAFGPATVADMRTWSGLTGLSDVVDRLRPQLTTFRDENGRELFDLPDAPRPDPDTPAPVRFLPDFDNALLSHADRSRFLRPERPKYAGHELLGAVLVDGLVSGLWRLARSKGTAMHIEPGGRLTKRQRAAVEREAALLLRVFAADAEARTVQWDVET